MRPKKIKTKKGGKKMKTKENQKKLKLDKQTIVNLERRVMTKVYGGDDGTIPPPGTDTEKLPSRGGCHR